MFSHGVFTSEHNVVLHSIPSDDDNCCGEGLVFLGRVPWHCRGYEVQGTRGYIYIYICLWEYLITTGARIWELFISLVVCDWGDVRLSCQTSWIQCKCIVSWIQCKCRCIQTAESTYKFYTYIYICIYMYILRIAYVYKYL